MMNWITFLTALAMVESGNDPTAVGDRNLRNKAYGIYQIRQPYLDDVNRIAGTNFTIEDMVESEVISRWCVVTYIKHYGRQERTGKPLTMEIASRLHNGGPNGYKRKSTDAHWNKMKSKLK